MREDIPLPFGLPAAALKYAPCQASRPQAVNGCFQAWASHSGQIGNGRNPPEAGIGRGAGMRSEASRFLSIAGRALCVT
jgi:hypothetical protein